MHCCQKTAFSGTFVPLEFFEPGILESVIFDPVIFRPKVFDPEILAVFFLSKTFDFCALLSENH